MRLNYDGHPGYDYKAEDGTSVFAAASGSVFYPHNMVGLLGSPNNAYCNFHVLGIAPDSVTCFRIYYLHLSTHPNNVSCPGSPPGSSTPLSQSNYTAPDGSLVTCLITRCFSRQTYLCPAVHTWRRAAVLGFPDGRDYLVDQLPICILKFSSLLRIRTLARMPGHLYRPVLRMDIRHSTRLITGQPTGTFRVTSACRLILMDGRALQEAISAKTVTHIVSGA